MTYTGAGGTVYDITHKYLFVSLTKFDRVDVFSTADYHLVASIPVPAPMGIDISADDSQVIVGSAIPFFFTIETQSLQVVGTTPIPLQGTGNPQVVAPTGLARASTGNLLLLVNVLNTSDSEQLAEWSPATGQITYRQDFQSPPACITSSADHTKILVGACGFTFAGAPGEEIGVYDAVSDSFTASLWGYGYLGGMASNANGTQFAASVLDNSLMILDSNLNVLTVLSGSDLGLQFLVGDLVYSSDGRYLYVIEANPQAGAIITVLDTTTFEVVGSQIQANGGSSYALPQFLQPPSIDENNILYVPLGGSIGVTPTPQTPFAVTPELVSVTPPQGFSQTDVATPITGDAPQQGLAAHNAGSDSGGTSAQYFVYGGNLVDATVGGTPALISSAEIDANLGSNLPGWMDALTIQVPSGREGLADVGIGTLTMKDSFNYVSEQIVPVSGMPWQLIYDQGRQQLYISNAAANRVEVFSLTSQRLLNPIPVGNSPHGLALTPDGSLLVVANSGDGTVTILNPDNPAGASIISLGNIGGTQPNEVAITNTGKAIVDYGGPQEIDLSTHAIASISNNRIYYPALLMGNKDGSLIVCDCGDLGTWDPNTRTWNLTSYIDEGVADGAISGDGDTIAQGDYILNPQLVITGQVAKWDFLPVPESISGHADFLNASGSLLYKTDVGSDAIHGTGVQIFDVNHGDLKEWVELSEPVSNNTQHKLTLDDTGQNLWVLTQSGFTAVNFAFVPLSVAYLNPSEGPAAGGVSLTVRGSGFEPGCQASLDGVPASTAFVDSQTLTIITPQLSAGTVQFSIQNPDGQTYSLDHSFTAQ